MLAYAVRGHGCQSTQSSRNGDIGSGVPPAPGPQTSPGFTVPSPSESQSSSSSSCTAQWWALHVAPSVHNNNKSVSPSDLLAFAPPPPPQLYASWSCPPPPPTPRHRASTEGMGDASQGECPCRPCRTQTPGRHRE